MQGYPYDDTYDEYKRQIFVSKVCFILAIQMALTTASVAASLFVRDIQIWFHHHAYVLLIAMALTFIISIIISCCQTVARSVPINYILLFIFTGCQCILLSCFCLKYKIEEVLMAVGLTTAICLGLTIFAFQTSFDFTTCGGVLLILMIVLIISSIVCFFFPSRTFRIIIASAGVAIFSFTLIYNLQLIKGGNHVQQYSEDDYIIAALGVYMDMIMIFYYILTLLGLLDE